MIMMIDRARGKERERDDFFAPNQLRGSYRGKMMKRIMMMILAVACAERFQVRAAVFIFYIQLVGLFLCCYRGMPPQRTSVIDRL